MQCLTHASHGGNWMTVCRRRVFQSSVSTNHGHHYSRCLKNCGCKTAVQVITAHTKITPPPHTHTAVWKWMMDVEEDDV